MKRFAGIVAVVCVLFGLVWSQSAVAAAPGGSITWTVDHARKTITVHVQLQIYSGCSGDVGGTAAQQAVACAGVRSQVTQFLADKIKSQIEQVWNGYQYKCYRLIVNVDVKLAPDRADVDPDRIAIQIDPSAGGVRSFVDAPSSVVDYNSDDPTARGDPVNDGEWTTTWSETLRKGASTYAHEFGHVIGLDDGYHDVTDPTTGVVTSEPRPDAPLDLMSVGTPTLAQETINRVVRRNMPLMRDTSGNAVTDKDLKCDMTLTIDSALVHQEIGSGPLGTAYDLFVTPEPDAPILLTVDANDALTGTTQVHIHGQVKLPVCIGAYDSTEQIDISGTVTTTDDNKRVANIKITGPPETGVSSVKCPKLGRSIPFGGHGGFANRWATVIGPLTLAVGDPPTQVSNDGSVGGVTTHSDGDFSVADASPPPS